MRKTKLKPIAHTEIEAITPSSASVQLKRCKEDQFALVDRDEKVLFPFESTALTTFLKTTQEEIVSVSLRDSYKQFGPGPKSIHELQLRLGDGTTLVINDRDRAYKKTEIQVSAGPETLSSPYSLWGLVPESPLVYMLLTRQIVDHLESRADEKQIEHLLRVLWHDYTHEKKRNDRNEMDIEGEFMRFRTVQINPHLVKFDIANP